MNAKRNRTDDPVGAREAVVTVLTAGGVLAVVLYLLAGIARLAV